MGLERRIAALEDRAEIAQLRAHYCHVLDHRQWDELASLFTEDGLFDGLARVQGRDAILRFFRDTVSPSAEGIWHFCTSPTIQLAEDRNHASGRISMQYLSLVDGVSYISAGHYDDAFRREDGAWRFARRKIDFHYMAPLSEGFVGRPTYIRPEGQPRTSAPA
ncbi:nuclear transport factor 2 family protein [Acidimangrovimonas sediminis]|uniref:nuclear transport factor 2 family protein n=1 Tax=Acidimangrovimonas sediminis TaxID=2056283 RepID=UPI000C80C4E7|nr:nuclear transport factor 2 family protein [Acidimangrovimonas sediminis]